MTTQNEPLQAIQARVAELQATIAEKEEQLKGRAKQLKEGLKEELSPTQLVKRYPLTTAGTTFLAGFLIARAVSGRKQPSATTATVVSSATLPSKSHSIVHAIGIEVMRSLKDMGIAHLKRYIEQKAKR